MNKIAIYHIHVELLISSKWERETWLRAGTGRQPSSRLSRGWCMACYGPNYQAGIWCIPLRQEYQTADRAPLLSSPPLPGNYRFFHQKHFCTSFHRSVVDSITGNVFQKDGSEGDHIHPEVCRCVSSDDCLGESVHATGTRHPSAVLWWQVFWSVRTEN